MVDSCQHMPRKTHGQLPDEERVEKIDPNIDLHLGPTLKKFLALEAKHQSEKIGRHVSMQDILRALLTGYYEKKMAGLLVNPDD